VSPDLQFSPAFSISPAIGMTGGGRFQAALGMTNTTADARPLAILPNKQIGLSSLRTVADRQILAPRTTSEALGHSLELLRISMHSNLGY